MPYKYRVYPVKKIPDPHRDADRTTKILMPYLSE